MICDHCFIGFRFFEKLGLYTLQVQKYFLEPRPPNKSVSLGYPSCSCFAEQSEIRLGPP